VRKGLGYPAQACDLAYPKFKSGWTYQDAYEQVAWGRGDAPRTITRRVVLRQLAKLKRDEFTRYQKDCTLGARFARKAAEEREGEYAEEGDTSFDVESLKKRAPLKLTRKPVQGEFPWRRRNLGGMREGYTREHHCRIEKLPGVEFKATICKDNADEYSIGIEHAHSGEPYGEAMLTRHHEKSHGPGRSRGKCAFTISWIEARHRGVGTKLYELSLAAATKIGCTLVSDSTRSPYAEAFWKKQERKGRAHCEGGTSRQPGASVYFPDNLFVIARQRRLQHGLPSGRNDLDMKHEMVAVIPSSLPKPKLDLATRNYRWPCKRWVIDVPAPRSLTGLKRDR